ncbi:FAD:protein FMN transferase [Collinsella sp. zg1085]|uniref:FAD:protein FMN transferase n=1 Tax=Collinsella sp. zg1085 TaxID=2844380 RepID=UPI001C0D20AF|nr:FAD:protein FMN transferase [Collinsella sp. zg1085]QWT17900.1 FAD:protein FMN transferase [Collinsella sp. zg1085]
MSYLRQPPRATHIKMDAAAERMFLYVIHDCEHQGAQLRMHCFNTLIQVYVYPGGENNDRENNDRENTDTSVPPTAFHAVLHEIAAYLAQQELLLSRTRIDSDVARAHIHAPAWIDVHMQTAQLIEQARQYVNESEGRFDLTMGTMTQLWDFHTGHVPPKYKLAQAREHVGMDKVCVQLLSHNHAQLCITDPDTVLDLGGIAKGACAAYLHRLLPSRGIHRYVLNLGGNVVVRGGRPCERETNQSTQPHTGESLIEPWRIGIVDPRNPDKHRAVLSMTKGSVATSGIHERSFMRGGVFYHHILNPQTGMPADTDLASASIVADYPLDGDGYSTTVLMLGACAGLAFCEARSGIEAVLITKRNEVLYTSGLAGKIQILPSVYSG